MDSGFTHSSFTSAHTIDPRADALTPVLGCINCWILLCTNTRSLLPHEAVRAQPVGLQAALEQHDIVGGLSCERRGARWDISDHTCELRQETVTWAERPQGPARTADMHWGQDKHAGRRQPPLTPRRGCETRLPEMGPRSGEMGGAGRSSARGQLQPCRQRALNS